MGFFKDSLKKWFYTNSSSAASSDARIPLLTSTGEPKGSDTMANLASVLGAYKVVSNIDLTNTSSSTYPKDGITYIINNSNSITGAPSGISALASCIVRCNGRSGGGYVSQIIQELQGEGNIWVRDVSAANISVNTNWIRVTTPSFYKNYADLSSLASAIGGFIPHPKLYRINNQNSSVVIDKDFSTTNRDSRILVIGYDLRCRRAGLATINYDKTINWILKPSGWDGYFRIDVGDTNISVTRVSSQDYFYCGILNWWT